MLKHSFARAVLAGCLVAAPVLWAIATLVGPNTDHGSSAAEQLKDLNAVAAHKGAYVASNTVFLLGGLVLILGAYAIVHVYRGRKIGVGQVAGVLLGLGGAVMFAWYSFGAIEYEMVNHSQLQNPATQRLFAEFLHLGNNSSATAPLFVISVLALVLGPILLGVAMIRRRNVPIWSGVAAIISGPATFVLNGRGPSLIGYALVLLAFVPLAVSIWRMSDEDWDAPREIAGARRDAAAASGPVAASPAPAV